MRLDANATLSAVAIPLPGGPPMSGPGNWARDAGEGVTTDAREETGRAQAQARAETEAQTEALITAVYTQHASAIHSYAYRLLGNQEDADDVTQEVFIRVHGRLEQLRDPGRLRPWLYRIATNLCMDQLRRRSRTRRIFGIAVSLDGGDDADDTSPHEVAHPLSSQAMDGVAERDHISRALRRMPPKYSTCLVLHSAQGLSYREIAEALGITPGAAAVRLARARDMFGRHYEDLREEARR
ncbi:MAG TPA: RNA polymerase sigma factor [Ktedonobacterales bacterium]